MIWIWGGVVGMMAFTLGRITVHRDHKEHFNYETVISMIFTVVIAVMFFVYTIGYYFGATR